MGEGLKLSKLPVIEWLICLILGLINRKAVVAAYISQVL